MGTPAQTAPELAEPVDALEADEDGDGRWRSWVNQRLADDDANWFSRLDAIIFLDVPDSDCVRRWRWQHEQDSMRLAGSADARLLSRQSSERFIQNYQRLTLHALRVMPAVADLQVIVQVDRVVASIDSAGKPPGAPP